MHENLIFSGIHENENLNETKNILDDVGQTSVYTHIPNQKSKYS